LSVQSTAAAAMKVVRDSKFRHVFGEAKKTKYEDLRLATKATESTGLRGNSKFVTFAWESGGGGTLCVLPASKFGRCPRDVPLITGHTGAILDFEFNPFDENQLITASEDLTLKLWQIPDEGLKAHMKDPVLNLEGHGKKISFATFNPIASHIVASTAFDMTTRLWNIAEEAEASKLEVPDQLWSLQWSYTGSLLAATCKDKTLKIIDPRAKTIASECPIHDGIKASKVCWLPCTGADDLNRLVTTGFTKQAERQMAVWDMRKFGGDGGDAKLQELELDNGTGALFPFFDECTQMLYIAGKGDANVRFFEATTTELHYLSQYSSTTPQKGFHFLPKRCVDVGVHEVARYLKLETNAILPVSFKVPRKSEAFQEDLFPDCPAGVPAMSPDDWVSSTDSKPPVLRSMKPGAESSAGAAKAAVAVVSVKDLKKQLSEAQDRIKELEKENEQLKAKLAEVGS